MYRWRSDCRSSIFDMPIDNIRITLPIPTSPMSCIPFVGTQLDEDKRRPCSRCHRKPILNTVGHHYWSGPVKDQPSARGAKASVHEFNAPLLSPCVPNRTSGRKCRIRTPDAIRSMVRNIRLSCLAYPRRQPRLSVLHRLKVTVSIVRPHLHPKTAAVNGFCSVAPRETTRWNLIQFGSTAQPYPPFLGTNRPCQAPAVRNTTARSP